MDRILLLAVAIVFNVSAFSQEREINIDHERYSFLIKRFDVNIDDFDGITWYWHKKTPDYDKPGIFCYFGTNGDKLGPLRLGINYIAGNWLFIKQVQIKILDKIYDLPVTNVKKETVYRDVGPGVRESIDEVVSDSRSSVEIINALLSVTEVKDILIKFKSDDNEDFMSITSWPKQLQAIKETVELYKAMGGTY